MLVKNVKVHPSSGFDSIDSALTAADISDTGEILLQVFEPIIIFMMTLLMRIPFKGMGSRNNLYRTMQKSPIKKSLSLARYRKLTSSKFKML